MTQETSNPAQLDVASELVTLPVTRSNGEPFRLRLWAPPLGAILRRFGTILGAGSDHSLEANNRSTDDPLAASLAAMNAQTEQARMLFEIGARSEPPIDFSESTAPGSLSWDVLPLPDRRAVILDLMRLAGQGPGRADEVATFPPVDRERPAVGAGPGGGEPDGGAPGAPLPAGA